MGKFENDLPTNEVKQISQDEKEQKLSDDSSDSNSNDRGNGFLSNIANKAKIGVLARS